MNKILTERPELFLYISPCFRDEIKTAFVCIHLLSTMTDATRRKLHIPNWYPPYLEKHRIYELFHELARELVIQKPADHVLFLRQLLFHACASKDAPRIVLLAPTQVDVYDVAKRLHSFCKATVITEKDIISPINKNLDKRPRSDLLVKSLSELIRSENVYETGWILPDFPRTWKEASKMVHFGILPTHVIQLIPTFSLPLNDLNYKKMPLGWVEYRRELLGMREIFKHSLKEIYTGERDITEVIHECLELLNVKKRYRAPIIPRVVILGPRGSGRKTQAKLIAKKFNLVHIDFERILMQNWITSSYLNLLLRATKDKLGEHSVLLTSIVHKKALEKECLNRGWVLTGFPNNMENMQHLDMIDTPPNRIIFLEANLNTCRDRVLNRRYNVHTGSITHLPELDKKDITLPENYQSHPKDKGEAIKNELNYYCEHYNAIRRYCGNAAHVIDANQPVQWVTECISAVMMRPMNDVEIRCPCMADDVSEPQLSFDSSGTCYCIDTDAGSVSVESSKSCSCQSDETNDALEESGPRGSHAKREGTAAV